MKDLYRPALGKGGRESKTKPRASVCSLPLSPPPSPPTRISVQVLPVGVGAEDQALGHEHGLALGGVAQHLGAVQLGLVRFEGDGGAGDHAAHQGLAWVVRVVEVVRFWGLGV